MSGEPRALVTGGSGFVGRRLVQRLSASGWDVHVLTSGSLPRDESARSGARWFGLGDDDLAVALEGVTHFFNFAVVYDRPEFSDALIDDVNVQLPLKILRMLQARRGDVTAILGDTFFRKFPVDATRQPRYTASKQRLADSARDLRLAAGARIALLQIEQVYGPGESVAKVLPRVAQQMLAHAPRIALTSGKQRRDFVHVDDVVSAACVAATAGWEGIASVECGTGRSSAVRDVFLRMHELAASRSVLGFGDMASDQKIDESKADNHWLRDRGWSCVHGLESGLQDFMKDMDLRWRKQLGTRDRAT